MWCCQKFWPHQLCNWNCSDILCFWYYYDDLLCTYIIMICFTCTHHIYSCPWYPSYYQSFLQFLIHTFAIWLIVLWWSGLRLDRFIERPRWQERLRSHVPECRLPLPWEHTRVERGLLLSLHFRGALPPGESHRRAQNSNTRTTLHTELLSSSSLIYM